MGQIEVHSGETLFCEEMKGEWLGMLHEPDVPWTFEDLLENRESTSVSDVVRKFKIIPRFQYIVNYLMMYFHCMPETGEKMRLFVYLEQKKKGKSVEDPACEKIWEDLVDRVRDTFQKNGLPQKKRSREYIQNLILNFSENSLYEAALGLQLPFEDMERFLCKVFYRSGVNFYNEKEYLLYLVLNYGTAGKEYACFLALQKDYKRIKEEEKEEKGNGDRSFLSGKEKTISNTVSIRETTEKILKEKKIDTLYDDPKMKVLNAQVEEILRWHSTLICTERTAKKKFRELMYQVKKMYAEELKGYSRSEKEQKQDARRKKNSESSGMIEVWYDPKEEITLEKNTVFYRLFDKNKEDTEKNRVRFYTTKKEILPQKPYASVIIPVKSLTEQKAEERGKGKLIPPGVEVQLAQGQKVTGEIASVKTKKGVQRFKDSKGKDKGMLIAKCSFGCGIPKGTQFFWDDGKECCRFESTEEVTAETLASEEIEVVCRKPVGKRVNGKLQVADTGSIRFTENAGENIRQICNRKPIKYDDMEQENEEASTFTIDVIQEKTDDETAEHTKIQKGQSFSLRKKDARVSKIRATSDFERQKDGEIRGKITISCEVGTDFPKGTEFFCTKDGRELVCRSEQDEINIKDLFFQRFLHDPINRGVLDKTISDQMIESDLFGDWFQKTIIDNNVINRFGGEGNERERDCLMTLLFMTYEAEMKTIYEERNDGRVYGEFDKSHFEDFEEYMDNVLKECRFEPFYMGNPYDCLLAFLSLSAADSINILRALWAIAKDQRGEENE